MTKDKKLIHPFPPVYDEHSKILILGSFPSVVSREKSFYYANQTNRFWQVMASIFKTEIEDKVSFCLTHHIALWDVIYSCSIMGSSDSSIHDVQVNEIQKLVSQTNVHTIFTTGNKASSLYEQYVKCDCEHISLPSTSAANARMRMLDLEDAYQIIKEKLNEK